ncbi:MAG: NAD(P)/FAD-dependent oxidoreductase, partial [Thermodesulfobacteriota bacterium]|nr:NAD(P)/FAD-dependent oxidoreductase [Thermodesulfobacteriota bacterium]
MEPDIIIVGGGPAGIITALTAKSVYPDKSVCLIKDVGDGVVPCAIPYMMHSMSDPKENIMGNTPLENAGIEIIVGKVVSLDLEKKTVILESGQQMSYDRLVLATGLITAMPKIPGVDKEGVFGIEKSLAAMTVLRKEAKKAKNVVVIGGGFIGAEFADELSRASDVKVHIVEIMPKLLLTAFDDEFCDEAADELRAAGVKVHTNISVASIDGGRRVESVTLEGGEKIPADMVIIGIGGKPNTEFARKAGLLVAEHGGIRVDAYMRTSTEGVFAVGDCAVKRDFFTRRDVPVWLASTA